MLDVSDYTGDFLFFYFYPQAIHYMFLYYLRRLYIKFALNRLELRVIQNIIFVVRKKQKILSLPNHDIIRDGSAYLSINVAILRDRNRNGNIDKG